MLTRISLQNFRNYKLRSFQFSNLNAITGKNGSGKTNLLEAISLLGIHSGFRGVDNSNLCLFESNNFQISFEMQNQKLDIFFDGKKRTYQIDGDKSKVSSFENSFKIIYLIPQDEFTFSQTNSQIKDFFDRIISCLNPEHKKLISRYKSLSQERFTLLMIDLNSKLLDTLESEMTSLYVQIAYNRTIFIQEISAFKTNVEIKITGVVEDMLNSSCKLTQIENRIKESFLNARKKELEQKQSTIGANKTIFEVEFMKKSTKTCSSGEQKVAMLETIFQATKLAQSKKFKTILLIDEIISKLDRQNSILAFESLLALSQTGVQIFATSIEEIETFNNIII